MKRLAEQVRASFVCSGGREEKYYVALRLPPALYRGAAESGRRFSDEKGGRGQRGTPFNSKGVSGVDDASLRCWSRRAGRGRGGADPRALRMAKDNAPRDDGRAQHGRIAHRTLMP